MKPLTLAASLFWLTAVVTASAASPGLSNRPTAWPSRYADGAPPGFSGAFGEDSCHACHFQTRVNTAPGHVTIDGVPERFARGRSYPLTVTLQRADMRTGGFQFTARFSDNGAQAGGLTAAPEEEERLKVETREGVLYVNQRAEGAVVAPSGSTTWTIVWTAPEEGGSVVRFNVAANAGNGDAGAEGDYVFTAVRESTPAP